MSFIYSRALVEEFLRERHSAGVVSVRWKTTPTVSAFSCSVKTTESWSRFLSGTTFEHFSALHGEVLLRWFREVSLARECQQQEKGKVLPIPDRDCGERWRGLLRKYDRVSCSWKTVHSLFVVEVPESSVILPKWGMMRSGELWERITPALPISGTEFGLWRTPTASEGRAGAFAGTEKLQQRQERHRSIRLIDQVKKTPSMWPTPTVKGNNNKKGSSPKAGDGLATAVRKFPTPTCMDAAGFCGKPDKGRKGPNSGRTLTGKVLELEGLGPHAETFPTPTRSMVTIEDMDQSRHPADKRDPYAKGRGTLNPNWVEWLMGWPIGYTDLKPLETDRFLKWQRQFGEC